MEEGKKVAGGKKQPYAIGLKGGGLMALARLWESWHSEPSGERVRSFAIVTTEPTNYARSCLVGEGRRG